MCSYNKINGYWACMNNNTNNGDLKGLMGFEGYIMTDWWAVTETAAGLNSGCD